jgi:hypothetical protein
MLYDSWGNLRAWLLLLPLYRIGLKGNMDKMEWQTKLAEFAPLYEVGAYTPAEFFWFALPLFDGSETDRELWKSLPEQVRKIFLAEVSRALAFNRGESLESSKLAIIENLEFVRNALTE